MTGRAIALIVVGAALVAVPAGWAVTGEVLRWPMPDPHADLRLTQPVEVASGTNPEFGRWRIYVSESRDGPCIGIQTPDVDPPGVAWSYAEGCGGIRHGFDASSMTGGSGPPRTAVYGHAPEEAARVTVTTPVMPSRSTTPVQIPEELGGGKFYFVSFPANLPYARAHVFDDEGQEIRAWQPIPLRDGPEAPAVPARTIEPER